MARPDKHGALPIPRFAKPPRLLLVAAPFYRAIADRLVEGASAALRAAGAGFEIVEVPGALEIAPAIRIASASDRYDGYVALGCVIRGETYHYELVCEESARGLTLLGVEHGHCIGNGVLTVETAAQAEARADPAGLNKGGGAATAALHLIGLRRAMRRQSPTFRPDSEHVILAGDPVAEPKPAG